MTIGNKLLVPPVEIKLGILMNTLVMDENEILGENEMANSAMLWDNMLKDATLSTSADSANVSNIYDGITSQKWNAGSGTVDIRVDFNDFESVNAFAIAASNTSEAGTVVEVYLGVPGVDGVLLADMSGIRDNEPRLIVFNGSLSTVTYTIRFISTGDLQVGQFALGRILEFPSSPTLGMELGKFNNQDKEQSQTTEGNNLAHSSTVANLRDNVFPFEAVPFTWIRSEWMDFQNNHKGGLVWFLWDRDQHSEDTVFGRWEADRIKYESAIHTKLKLTIKGHVA